MWLARSLEISAYGQWGVLYAVQSGVATFALTGIYESTVGLRSRKDRQGERACISAGAIGAFFVSGSAFTLLICTVALLLEPLNTGGVMAACASGYSLAFVTLRAQLLRLDERHIASLMFGFVTPLAAYFVGAAAFKTDGNLEYFFWGMAASTAAMAVVIRDAAHKNQPSQYDTREAIKSSRDDIIRRVPPFVLSAFFGWMSGYGNNLIVVQFFSEEAVGRFTFALTLSAAVQLTASAMNQVWGPMFFRLIREEELDMVERKSHKFFSAQCIALGGACGIIVLAVDPIIGLAGGNLGRYAGLHLEFTMLLSAYIVATPWWHCTNHLLAHDLGAAFMRLSVAAGIIGFVAWLGIMRWLGEIGIYIGFFALVAIKSVVVVLYTRRRWEIHVPFRGILVGLCLAAIGYVGAARHVLQ